MRTILLRTSKAEGHLMDYRVLNGFKRVFGAAKKKPKIGDPRDPNGSDAAPERAQTDQGLRTERSRTDQALAERQDALNEEADLVVHRARENADAIVVAARDMADDALDPATTPAG